jgi:DNA-binding HxlR family transcriptional regulator
LTTRNARVVRVAPGTTLDRYDSTRPSRLTAPLKVLSKVSAHDHVPGTAQEASAPGPSMVPLPGDRLTSPAPMATPVWAQSSAGVRVAKEIASARQAPGGHSASKRRYVIMYLLEEHRGTLEILLLLLHERTASKSRMRAQLRPGPEALDGALRSLHLLDLVESQLVRVFPFGRTYRLTERGEALLATSLGSWPGVIAR